MPTDATPDRPIRVLLIDDDRDDFVITRDLLAEVPGDAFHLDWAPNYEEGLASVCRAEHDIFLLDYRLGARTGLDLLREATERKCAAPIILLTGQGQREVDVAAMKAGAADYLEKARLDATLLDRAIRYALLQKRLETELERKVRERTAELNRANEALQREIAERAAAEEKLREADRRKDEFLATLAHELRNPLAPIRNALEIMRLAGDNPSAVEGCRSMLDRQVAQLVRLIDDLLDVSRITRGKLRLNLERTDLGGVLESALEISRPLIEKGELRLHVEVPPGPVWLQADPVRLSQVFSNLLNNAAKYTEPGGRVSLVAARQGDGVEVAVRDSGMGIPPEMLPKVFELFTQVDRSLERSQGGLGIGLALVHRLVEMHQGTVAVHSDGVGTGATFTVRLPLAEAGIPAEPAPTMA